MHHLLSTVAETHNFDLTKFQDFAKVNHDKMGIITMSYDDRSKTWYELSIENWTVSTWYVDDLVKAFKLSLDN